MATETLRPTKVIVKNRVSESDNSNTDTGYRVAGSLNYQWQRSAEDSYAIR